VIEADQLILEAATGLRHLRPEEIRQITEHVAQAGWDDRALETVRGPLAGFIWQGHPLQGRDKLASAVTHYLWHVVKQREWPDDRRLTTTPRASGGSSAIQRAACSPAPITAPAS